MTRQQMYQLFCDGLKKYVPENALPIVAEWLTDHNVYFTIARKRTSKLGDYRPPHNGKGHRISVNGNLNPYHFLEVLTHEVAHLLTRKKYGRGVSPHGSEWKVEYQNLVQQLLKKDIFPQDIESALINSITNPAASSCVDVELCKAMRKYDPEETPHPDLKKVLVEDIAQGQRFMLENGRTFVMGKKLRKRYKCMDLKNERWYTLSALAQVFVLKKDI